MRKVLFILGQLSDSDVEWLASNGQRQRVARGELLIRSGTRIETMFIVLEGRMSVLAPNGVLLGDVGSGDILGEMSLIDSSRTAASIRVDEDSVVLAIANQRISRKLAEDIAFSARFHRALAIFLADRMRNTIRRMGFGDDANTHGNAGDDEDSGEVDELDVEVLDNIHLAGARFERMLKKLAG